MKQGFIIKNKTLRPIIITAFLVFQMFLSVSSTVITDVPRCFADEVSAPAVQDEEPAPVTQDEQLHVSADRIISTFPLPDEYLNSHKETKHKDAVMLCDFEEEESETSWTQILYEVKIKRDAKGGHNGGGALLCDERNSCFDGPALDISHYVKPETSYYIRYCVKYTRPESMSSDEKYSDGYIRLSIKKQYKGSDKVMYTNIDTILSPAEGEWYEGEGIFSLPYDIDNVKMYFESNSRTSTIWVDDIVLGPVENIISSGNTISDTGTTVYGFEETIPDIFNAVNNAKLATSNEIAIGGASSLRVGRIGLDSSSGVAVDISSLTPEKQYRCSTSITHLDKEAYTKNFSMYLRYKTSDYSFRDIPLVVDLAVNRASWSSMSSVFTLPVEARDPVIYIASTEQAADEINKPVSFYIDDFTVTDSIETMEDIERSRKKKIITISIITVIVLALTYTVVSLINKRRLLKQLEEAAKDSMTGAYNRNTYEERIKALADDPETVKKLFFAVCDVNGLKMLNDNYSHQIGDSCIIKCAGLLLDVMKQSRGKVYRTGGDEFVCISTEPFKDQLTQKLSAEEQSFTEYPFAVAVGFAQYNSYEDGKSPDIKEIIDRCDKEMYLDKKRKQKNTKTY